jgi:hypothetical protein
VKLAARTDLRLGFESGEVPGAWPVRQGRGNVENDLKPHQQLSLIVTVNGVKKQRRAGREMLVGTSVNPELVFGAETSKLIVVDLIDGRALIALSGCYMIS